MQRFCPSCGQEQLERDRPLWSFLRESLGELFSVDGKLARTLVKLLRPGRLTQAYAEGKRASFVAPARLYVLCSLLFFLLVGIPSPDTEHMNVYIGETLVGRDEPLENARGRMQLLDVSQSSWTRRWYPDLQTKLDELKQRPVQDVVDRYFDGLERTFPTALIAFVPFLALALKLLYVRRRIVYLDHLVFALHAQSFLFLSFVLARLLNAVGFASLIPGFLTYLLAFLLLFPLYVFLALRRFYGQAWWKSALKAGALAFMYMMLIQPIMGLSIVVVILRL